MHSQSVTELETMYNSVLQVWWVSCG